MVARLTKLALDTDNIITVGDNVYTNSKQYTDAHEKGKPLPSGHVYLHEMQPDIVSEEEGMENPHFRVWMHIEAFPTFQKLYGKFSEQEDGFAQGQVLVIDVVSRYDVESFDGSKYLVLAAESVPGPRGWLPVNNIAAPLSFLIPGLFSFLLGVFVLVSKFTPLGRKPGEVPMKMFGCAVLQPCSKLRETLSRR